MHIHAVRVNKWRENYPLFRIISLLMIASAKLQRTGARTERERGRETKRKISEVKEAVSKIKLGKSHM